MALPTINDDEVFELTNIKVKEVSLVDRAANQRKFIVTKRDKKGTGEVITAEDVAIAAEKAQENFAGTPAAELDRQDAAAVKAEEAPVTEIVSETTTTTVAVVAEVVNAASTETIVQPTDKSVVVTEGDMADINVTTNGSSNYAGGTAEAALATKMRMAWLGAIDAIRARLDAMAEAVNRPTDGPYVHWEAYGHIDYICCMLDSFYSIGGPEWDIAVAAVAAASKSAGVQKRHAELKKFTVAIRDASPEKVQKMFEALTTEPAVPVTEPAKVAEKSEAALVVVETPPPAPVVPDAVITPVDISENPILKGILEAQKAQQATIAKMQSTIDVQDRELAKARSTIRSNALTEGVDTRQTDVKWDRDMASPSARVRNRLGR